MSVEQLRQLEQAATPGPWSSYSAGSQAGPWDFEVHTEDDDTDDARGHSMIAMFDGNESAHDARLIAAMRNALPALLDIAEAAQELNDLASHVTRIDVDRDMNELAAALSRLDTEVRS